MKPKILIFGLLYLISMTAVIAQQPTLEWVQRYDEKGVSDDQAVSVAIDAEGNSYVTGTSRGIFSRMSTIKYSPSGELLWAVQFEKFSKSNAIVVDNAGGVYVTGIINNNVIDESYDDRDEYYYNDKSDFATIRYDAATGKQTWVQRYNGPTNNSDAAKAITVDNAGSVYVTGTSGAITQTDFATIRYDAATGKQVWVQRYDGPAKGADNAIAIITDNAGGIYVTGTSRDYTNTDFATIRYDAATGKQEWVQRYDGPGKSSDDVKAIAIDKTGGVYVTGRSTGKGFSLDFATIRYNAATGKQTWVQRYDKRTSDVNAITVDNAGGVYVTGSIQNDGATIRYDAATGKQTWLRREKGLSDASAIVADEAGGIYTSSGMGLIRYDAATGVQTWAQQDGPAIDIAIDNYGSIYTVGTSLTEDTHYDFSTIRHDAATGKQSWIQRYDAPTRSNNAGTAIAVDDIGGVYVTGSATIRYDAATGAQTWVQQDGSAIDIATDNAGGVYVINKNLSSTTSSFEIVTTRYDAATGKQTWMQQESITNNALSSYEDMTVDIAIDNTGGVYVVYLTGSAQGESSIYTVFNAVRYEAASGKRTWAESYEWLGGGVGEYDFMDLPLTIAMSVDNNGGLYLTGSVHNAWYTNFATMRCDAATGKQAWAEQYKRGDNPYAIAVDTSSGVYVTGSSNGEGYATVRYDAATGKQTWVQQYNGPAHNSDAARAIAVDNAGGLYVSGRIATIRYEAATGKQMWAQQYDGLSGGFDSYAPAIAVDYAGSVYVTGSSYGENGFPGLMTTIRYDAITGEQIWMEPYDRGDSRQMPEIVDMALDRKGNIFITGSDYGTETGLDILTIKYSQCSAVAEATIAGSSTARAGTKGVSYALSESGASSFVWSITDSEGNAHTGFTGQGTSAISINWPTEPNAYKVSVTYGGASGCPTSTAIRYVHVSDPAAGFVVGGGWSDLPTNSAYELMQTTGKVYWGMAAKYEKQQDDDLLGSMLLLVENESDVFRSTALENGSLVISGNRAYFRGYGTLTRLYQSGTRPDPRRFAFLVAATDGQLGTNTGPDLLRIKIWVVNADGSEGPVVFDNQAGCPSANLDENTEACAAIDKGAIAIYKTGAGGFPVSNLFAAATATSGLKAYPTTFSDRTILAFTTESNAAYSLDLYDLKGTLVQRVATGTAETGKLYEHELQANKIAKGLYLARLTTGGKVQTVKLVVQK